MNPLLKQGIVDALGFVGGALAGIFAPGYDNASIGGILLCGLGGGAGLQLARWALAKTRKDDDQK
jgi:hypothetical protein